MMAQEWSYYHMDQRINDRGVLIDKDLVQQAIICDMMLYGLTWSLELYQQTNARLWRQGQQNTVTIHHIVTKDTVDEDVLKALASKDVTQEKLIAAVKARL